MYFSHLDKACFAVFLQHLQDHLAGAGIGKVLLIGDGATAHTAQDWSTYRMDWQKLPTACPELNPVERFFEELRKLTANQVFANTQQLEDCITRLLVEYQQQPEKVSKLTFYPYLNKSA
jgi:transposase